MLNIFAKLLLVLTALSPVLGGVAVNQFAKGMSWMNWVPWLGAAILLVLLCWMLLQYTAKNAQRHLCQCRFTFPQFRRRKNTQMRRDKIPQLCRNKNPQCATREYLGCACSRTRSILCYRI